MGAHGPLTNFGECIVIDQAACVGCVACVKACPTQAIRVRDQAARVRHELCIDCGACVRVCPHNAARAVTSPPSDLKKFKHTVALPSLTLYGQFGRDLDPSQMLAALTQIGFDAHYDISWMCEMVAAATDAYLTECSGPWPKISVNCPAIVRLIQIRYPSMIANLTPIETPRELAAKLVRRKVGHTLGLAGDEIGVFFITPCTAVMNSIVNPVGLDHSYFDGALSIADVYAPLRKALERSGPGDSTEPISPVGLLWAMAGGELAGMRNANTMTVRGGHDVKYVFDRIEAGKYAGVDFIEAYICPDGCVSGGLTVEGRFAAQRSIQRIARRLRGQRRVDEEKVRTLLRERFFDFEEGISARPVQALAGGLRQAIARKRDQEALLAQLPHKDCAACGAPNCAVLAEDIVHGEAALTDCVFVRIGQLEQRLRAQESRQ